MHLPQLLNHTEFDGTHLYFNNLPGTDAKARLKAWPELTLERQEANLPWEREWLDFEIPLLHVTNQQAPAVYAWNQTIPSEVRSIAQQFYSSQLAATMLLRQVEAIELAKSHPQLFWLLCECLESELHTDSVTPLLRNKRRDLLATLLNQDAMPSSAVRFLSKLEATPDTFQRKHHRLLIQAVRQSTVRESLRHYDSIPVSWLSLATKQPSLFSLSVIRKIAAHEQTADLHHAARLIRDIRYLRDSLGPLARGLGRYENLQTLEQVQGLHDRLTEALNAQNALTVEERLADLKEHYGTKFPRAPIQGTSTIVPIETPEALTEEGKTMQHCVGSYAVRTYEKRSYIFKILAPERATLELRQQGTKLTIHQLSGPRNAQVSEETYAAVHEWLDQEKSTAGGS